MAYGAGSSENGVSDVPRDSRGNARVARLAGEMGAMLAQAGKAWAGLAADYAPESTATLCNREEGPRAGTIAEAIRRSAEAAREIEGLRNIVGNRCVPADEFEAEVSAHAAVRDAADATWSEPKFIPSEREHYSAPSPAFDPRAAAETCSHDRCRRRAFASLSNIDGDTWLSCAEHYAQDLAAQARSAGHEPAWRVPIAPGVVLERWGGGPIGVRVDDELRCYITAGELARIFEGPVA